ncbi:MAG TPA: VOC family protein [Polyangia bacterium]|jgi:hypothetical protein|nr:VOC family protein [Polyangia bacterium]
MPRPIHFEIHAQDPERAIRFYTDLFGWQFQRWGTNDYWIIVTGPDGQPGINGGLVLRRGDAPGEMQAINAFVCTIEVPQLDETLGRMGALGGRMALPKMPVPGVGWLAYIKDTEGNILGLMQPDKDAH